jgi:hypothetical protein
MTSIRRWLIPAMPLVMNTVNYPDRVNISVAEPDVAGEFHLGPAAAASLGVRSAGSWSADHCNLQANGFRLANA